MSFDRTCLQWRYQKVHKRMIWAICSRLYRDTNRDITNSILIAGTGRSGTTWLASLVATQLPCRIMFEPFHSKKVRTFHQFQYFQYMRPTDPDDELHSYCQAVFSGNIRDRWIDRQVETILPRYRLVKAIRANLFLKWIETRFPEVPMMLIIRHPCAVVLSRMRLKWATDGDIEPFLKQPKLIEDFLADKIDIITRVKTVEEKHAIIWCISNLVPLKQFGQELNVIFYENMCVRPNAEIPKIFRIIGHEFQDSVFDELDKPSTTTVRTSAVVTGNDKVTRWKHALSKVQISNILAVVEAFGLEYLYNESGMPLVTSDALSQRTKLNAARIVNKA